MRIRMRAEDSYPLDEAGRERVLPYGGVFEVPDDLAAAMIARETAEPADPVAPQPLSDPEPAPASTKTAPRSGRAQVAA